MVIGLSSGHVFFVGLFLLFFFWILFCSYYALCRFRCPAIWSICSSRAMLIESCGSATQKGNHCVHCWPISSVFISSGTPLGRSRRPPRRLLSRRIRIRSRSSAVSLFLTLQERLGIVFALLLVSFFLNRVFFYLLPSFLYYHWNYDVDRFRIPIDSLK